MEHTKGPWKAWDDDETGTLPCILAEQPTSFGNFYVAQCNVFADARHIVRCVNAHDALVQALKSVGFFREGGRCWCESGWDIENDGHQGQCIAARAALALAEK